MTDKPGSLSIQRYTVRVPRQEWIAVKRGLKTEFRASNEGSVHYRRGQVETPTPVVASVERRGGGQEAEYRLMVLLDYWTEPLGAITPESLEAEGCDSLADFKQRWCATRERRFNPLKRVAVYRMRPWRPEDDREMADLLFNRVYPESIPR